jgi:hypothetical protein
MVGYLKPRVSTPARTSLHAYGSIICASTARAAKAAPETRSIERLEALARSMKFGLACGS